MNSKTNANYRRGADLSRLPSHQGRKARFRTPKSRRRRPRRTKRILVASALFIICAITAILATGAFVPVLERQTLQALERQTPDGFDVEAEGASFAFHFPASIGVTLHGLHVDALEKQTSLFQAERVAVTFSAASLIKTSPKITHVNVAGATVFIPNRESQTLRFAEMNIVEARKRWVAERIETARDYLSNFAEDPEVKVQDLIVRQGQSQLLHVKNARLLADDGVVLSARIERDAGISQGTTDIAARASFSSGGDLRVLQVDSSPIQVPVGGVLRAFSDYDGDRNWGSNTDTIDLAASFTLRSMGNDQLDAVVQLDSGEVGFRLGKDNVLALKAPLRLSHRTGDQSISVLPGPASLGRSSFELSGGMRWVEAPSGGFVDIELITNEGILAPSDVAGVAVPFSSRLRARYDPVYSLVSVLAWDIVAQGGRFATVGQIDFSQKVPLSVLNMSSEAMSTSTLQKFWPAPIARAARRWVLDSVAGGVVRNIEFNIVEPLRKNDPDTGERIRGDTTVTMDMEGVRFDVAGDMPPVRDASGSVQFADGQTRVLLESGRLFMDDGLFADAENGALTIEQADENGLVDANLTVDFSGTSRAIGRLITYQPISAQRYYDYNPVDLNGSVSGRFSMNFVINDIDANGGPDWSVDLQLREAGSGQPIEGRTLEGLNGAVTVSPTGAIIDAKGTLDGLPASMTIQIPFGDSAMTARRDIELVLGDEERKRLAPGLETILAGTTTMKVRAISGTNRIEADLTNATLTVPWLNWTKGRGIAATAAFTLVPGGSTTLIDDFELEGATFRMRGSIRVDGNGLVRARLNSVALNPGDAVTVVLERSGQGYSLELDADTFDARTLLRRIRASMRETSNEDTIPLIIKATANRLVGFDRRPAQSVMANIRVTSAGLQSAEVNGQTGSGMPFSLSVNGTGAARRVQLQALDAGEFLRFADLYGQVRGGVLNMQLNGGSPSASRGRVIMEDFRVFDEPKIERLVSSRSSDAGNLRQATGRDLRTDEVRFEVASADLTFVDGRLDLDQAFIRGPLVGLTLRGTAFDSDNQMQLAGTFLPAYGLNSLFAEIPLLGQVLGNGRDRGLIGVTFLLSGEADAPQVTVNPLSVIAPGIFRSIFEFQPNR